ncbi:hypothetical protein V5E97_27215 [Singulisphaera sp. Ch08]|uniref:Uncharacterized protein n=1 Tax=Singulisphaera sp. Ch08 TaxID=3120278 RepID=A0AAU7CAG4_9BACT
MKLLMAVGVSFWVVMAVWVARLGIGLDQLSQDQIPATIVGGVCGGLAAWYFVPHCIKRISIEQK